jgi:hypothetical protein
VTILLKDSLIIFLVFIFHSLQSKYHDLMILKYDTTRHVILATEHENKKNSIGNPISVTSDLFLKC